MIEILQIISSFIAGAGGVFAAYMSYKNKIEQEKFTKKNEQLRFYIKQNLTYYILEEMLYKEMINIDNTKNERSLKVDFRKKAIEKSKYKIENFKRPSNMKDLLSKIEEK